MKLLNEMEQSWVADQKKLKLKRIAEKIEKGSIRAEASQYVAEDDE